MAWWGDHFPNGPNYLYDMNFRKQAQQHSPSFWGVGCPRSWVLFASCHVFPVASFHELKGELCLAQLSFPRNLFLSILALNIISPRNLAFQDSNSWIFMFFSPFGLIWGVIIIAAGKSSALWRFYRLAVQQARTFVGPGPVCVQNFGMSQADWADQNTRNINQVTTPGSWCAENTGVHDPRLLVSVLVFLHCHLLGKRASKKKGSKPFTAFFVMFFSLFSWGQQYDWNTLR